MPSSPRLILSCLLGNAVVQRSHTKGWWDLTPPNVIQEATESPGGTDASASAQILHNLVPVLAGR